MEELEEIVQRMMDENTPEEEIKKYIKDYKAGKLNGAAEKGATATPTRLQGGKAERCCRKGCDCNTNSGSTREYGFRFGSFFFGIIRKTTSWF